MNKNESFASGVCTNEALAIALATAQPVEKAQTAKAIRAKIICSLVMLDCIPKRGKGMGSRPGNPV